MPNLGNAQGELPCKCKWPSWHARLDGSGAGPGTGRPNACLRRGDTLTLFDVATGKQVRQWKAPNPIFTLAFAPDGKSLVSRGQDQVLRLWDVAEGKEIRKFVEQPKPQQAGGFALYRRIGRPNGVLAGR